VEVVVVVAALEVDTEDAKAVLAMVVLVLLDVTLPVEYMLSLLGPPQYSVRLLLQVMLQSVDGALTAPVARLLPQ
jgi:hypothetical protein